jgi:GT2 family glycosyltransferase
MSIAPLVSIITVNYNQLIHTCALLESLRKISYPSIEIIVVDNHSAENPQKKIQAEFPEVILVLSESNLGFAGGNNLGIEKAKGKYLLFINNDTEVDAEFLEPLVDMFEHNPKAGIASPKIIYYNTDNIIQYAGCYRINPYTGRNKRIGYKEKDLGQHDTLRETDLAHGAAMMVPRTVIDKAGEMPAIFFLYYEELDWCEAIKNCGYSIYVVPASKVYHKESMSVGKNSTLKTYYMTRNRLLFMRRNTKGVTKLSWILFFLIFSIPKNIAGYILKREIDQLKAFWRGFVWNVTHHKNGDRIKLLA